MPTLDRALVARTLLSAALWMSLVGCGSGDQATASKATVPSGTSQPPTSNRPQRTAREQRVEYARVVVLDLADVALPSDLTATQLIVKSGDAEQLTIRRHEIRFVTPSDPGADQVVVLNAALADKDVVIPIRVETRRPIEIGELSGDSDKDDTDQKPAVSVAPALVVDGLGVGHAGVGGALSFGARGAPILDPHASAATIYSERLKQVYDLAGSWHYDAKTNRLVVPAAAMDKILENLPAEDLSLDVGLASEDGEFAYAYTLAVHKPTAQLRGRVVDPDGRPLTSLAGTKIGITGVDNQTRVVTTVDDVGAFSVRGLVAGTHRVTLLDIARPDTWMAFVPVFANSKTVELTMTVVLPGSGANAIQTYPLGATHTQTNSIRTESPVTQDGDLPPSRDLNSIELQSRNLHSSERIRPMSANPRRCESGSGTTKTYTVSGAAQGSTVECQLSYTVPTGTKNVGIEAIVSTEERVRIGLSPVF